MEWIKSIASGIISPIAGVFVKDKELQIVKSSTRLEIAKAEAKRDVARINADAKKFEQGTALDIKKVKVSATVDQQLLSMRRNSYLDEIVILLILLPAVLVFVPSCQPYIKIGFAILQTLPDFYQALLVLVVVMTVGGVGLIRDLLGKFNRKV